MKSEYNGWNIFDKVIIVEQEPYKYKCVFNEKNNTFLYVENKEDTLPLGYICDPNNKKAIENAKLWATWSEHIGKRVSESSYIHHEPIINEFDNAGFKVELLEAAGNSSAGGKLSFWNCKVSKNGKSWKIGIAANLLLDVLKNTTINKGTIEEELFFARKNGNVGLLCKSMEAYKEAISDKSKKEELKNKKTKKQLFGYVYENLTEKNVYLGKIYKHYTILVDKSDSWRPKYTLAKLPEPRQCIVYPSYNENKNKLSDYSIVDELVLSIPARKASGEKLIIDTDFESLFEKQKNDSIECFLKEATIYSCVDFLGFYSISKETPNIDKRVLKVLENLGVDISIE